MESQDASSADTFGLCLAAFDHLIALPFAPFSSDIGGIGLVPSIVAPFAMASASAGAECFRRAWDQRRP